MRSEYNERETERMKNYWVTAGFFFLWSKEIQAVLCSYLGQDETSAWSFSSPCQRQTTVSQGRRLNSQKRSFIFPKWLLLFFLDICPGCCDQTATYVFKEGSQCGSALSIQTNDHRFLLWLQKEVWMHRSRRENDTTFHLIYYLNKHCEHDVSFSGLLS